MSLVFRAATIDDSYAVFGIFLQTVMDLSRRLGTTAITGGDDPRVIERLWERRCSLYDHLARTAAQFWLAERDGQPVGYARSILRDDVCALTEYFVLPGHQSRGVGRELLARSFAPTAASRRMIVATIDVRATARYLKAGVYPRFPIYYFSREPQLLPLPDGLTFVPIIASTAPLDALAAIDRAVIGHRRDQDHAWLLSDRQGYLYYRDSQPIGYGYIGDYNGPFALLHMDDFPAVLAHAERTACERGYQRFGLDVPLINRSAVDYLLAREFRLDSFFTMLMSDTSFGCFEQYIFTTPTFFW